MIYNKAFHAIQYLVIYLKAMPIAKKHYDYQIISKSKWFQGGRYDGFTATGRKWIINDYKGCKLLGVNQDVPWPCSPHIQVVCHENITFHLDDLNNSQTFGSYFQAIGKISIGRGTWIASNVGTITGTVKSYAQNSLQTPAEMKSTGNRGVFQSRL